MAYTYSSVNTSSSGSGVPTPAPESQRDLSAPSRAVDAEANDSGDAAAKPKERFAYLDHVKFQAMIAIFMMHSMSEPFAYCKDRSFWTGPPPDWMHRVQIMHAQFGLAMFALSSGAVSKPDISVERLLTYVRQLLLPVVLMFYWYQVIFFMPAGKAFPSWEGQLKQLIGMHSNFLWYLRALFVWRVLLMLGGRLPDYVLISISLVARAWMCTNNFGYEGPGFIGQTFLLFPFYILGYVVFAKGKQLEPFVRFVADNVAVRRSTFVAYLFLWIDVVYFGKSQDMIMEIYTYMRMGKVAHIIANFLMIPLSLAYGFVASAWLPIRELPIVSEAGRQTLYCYMFNTTGVMCAYNLWRYLDRGLGGPHWFTWVWFQPLLVLFLSSAPLRFFVWPLASPGWALRHPVTLRLEQATEEKWVKRVGLPVWFAIVVSGHVAFVLAIQQWGSPRQCAIP